MAEPEQDATLCNQLRETDIEIQRQLERITDSDRQNREAVNKLRTQRSSLYDRLEQIVKTEIAATIASGGRRLPGMTNGIIGIQMAIDKSNIESEILGVDSQIIRIEEKLQNNKNERRYLDRNQRLNSQKLDASHCFRP